MIDLCTVQKAVKDKLNFFFFFNLRRKPIPLNVILPIHSYTHHPHSKRFICSSVVRVFFFHFFHIIKVILSHVCIFLEVATVIHRTESFLINLALTFTLMCLYKHVCIVSFVSFFLTFIHRSL